MSNYLIRNYPELYKYFKELEFTWDRTGGDPIKQPNTNSL
jgi:D-alanyl-D-alanine carboxypeptidase (penicillin-binding protein 5/6)